MTHSAHVQKLPGLEQTSSDDEKTSSAPKCQGRVPGFIAKAVEIFSNTEFAAYCGWSRNGDTIMIHNIAEFASRVLPKYFKHSNYASFVRQLNMYDFHKTCSNPHIAEFQHPSFIRSRPDMLRMIKRKSRRDAAVAQQEKLALAASMSAAHMGPYNMRPGHLTSTSGHHHQPSHDVDSVHTEVIPAAANLPGGAERPRPDYKPHAKRKAPNFEADLDRPTKHLAMTHSNNSYCESSDLRVSRSSCRPDSTIVETTDPSSSLAADQAWKTSIERHLLHFQAEIQSLRRENLSLRQYLSETDLRMEMTLEKLPANVVCQKRSITPGALTLSKGRDEMLAFSTGCHFSHVNEEPVPSSGIATQPTIQEETHPQSDNESDLSSDTVDESKYELSPNASPEWTGLLNYTDYDVDSECIIGSLFSIEA